eukprot:TRINITY_DN2476_c0_g1_i2.p1 TRINITY_DN2476_c0_g1~~TRINITY_DN2476_c0_g1_i2.p1  ORF type:complete len:165 (+),score=17.60 TRINITY_DN2476_c0_g1_i2:61-495(+)
MKEMFDQELIHSRLEAKHLPSMGWGLHAREFIHKDEVFILERPLITINVDESACYHCGNSIVDRHVCDGCNVETYCSSECRTEAAMGYHRSLCGTNINSIRQKVLQNPDVLGKTIYHVYKMVGMALNQMEKPYQPQVSLVAAIL